MHMRSLLVLLLLATSQVGCGPKSNFKEAGAEGQPAAPAAIASAATTSDAPAAVRALADAGAELTTDKAGQVTQVAFQGQPITEALAAELAKLPALQTLVIHVSEMKVPGWQLIGQLRSLKQLDIRDCRLGDAHFKAAVSGLRDLVAIRMSGKSGETSVSDEGLVALTNCPKLKVLAGDYLFISEVSLSQLSSLRELKELYLAGSLVDDAALGCIASMPALTKLRIAKTSVGKKGLEQLVQMHLEELDISECSKLDDAALEPVGKLLTLKKLNLWRDAIGDQGVAWLSPLVNLEWLNVDNTQLTDAGLKSFANFEKLAFLHLGSTAVSDAGMLELLPLKNLRELQITRTSVTPAGLEPLLKALPQLRHSDGKNVPASP